MRPINLIYLVLPFLASSPMVESLQMDKSLFICYGKISPDSIQGYELVILEAQHYTPKEIAMFKAHNSKVLGYLSITEVNGSAAHYNSINRYTFGQNINWGSSFIDISNNKAQDILLSAANELHNIGLDGFFLDNLDNASQWGELRGQEENLVQLIKRIRQSYPNSFIVQNSGLFIANQLKHTTDAVLVESVVTDYDFKENKYVLKDKKTKISKINELKSLQRTLAKPIKVVEYTDDQVTKEKIESCFKGLGFDYFITNITLQAKPKFKP